MLNLASKRIYLGPRIPLKKTLLFWFSGLGVYGLLSAFPGLSRKTFPWASCVLCLWLFAASFMVNIFPHTPALLFCFLVHISLIFYARRYVSTFAIAYFSAATKLELLSLAGKILEKKNGQECTLKKYFQHKYIFPVNFAKRKIFSRF